MIYIFVLFGSFFGICAILGARVALKNRHVRKFVRSVKQRTEKARERGMTMRETRFEKSKALPRASAVALQKSRSLLREAEKAIVRQSYNDAEKLLIQALTSAPDCTEASAELAKLYLVTDRNAKAEALYRELLVEDSHVSLYANLGLACYKQSKFTEACNAYESALRLDPKNPERVASLGRARMANKEFAEAAMLFEQAAERMARDTALLHMLATCYERTNQPGEAYDTYKKIHKLQPYDERVKEKLATLASA